MLAALRLGMVCRFPVCVGRLLLLRGIVGLIVSHGMRLCVRVCQCCVA